MHSLQNSEKKDSKHNEEITKITDQFHQDLVVEITLMKMKEILHKDMWQKLPSDLSHKEKFSSNVENYFTSCYSC